MFSSDAFRALWNPLFLSPRSRPADGDAGRLTDMGRLALRPGDAAWAPSTRRRAQRQAVETLRVNREAKLAQWALEYRVGCAVLTLVEAGRPVSDAAAIDLMELSGADMATVFKVLDRVRVDIANA
jgi:hypothetical protein